MYNQYLQQVIDKGMDMLRSGNVSEEMFHVWLDWSQTVLRLIVKNPKISSDYMNVVLASMNPVFQPYERLSMCLRYLIQMLPLL